MMTAPGPGRPHKLTEAEQDDVRKLYASGNYTQRRLAGMFRVSQPTISRVLAEVRR
jgi:hypothetical protein